MTDNGLEFTNRLLKHKKGEICKTPSKFDAVVKWHLLDETIFKKKPKKFKQKVLYLKYTSKQGEMEQACET